VVSYGSSVFEGIRCYSTPSGPAVFRLREHVRRMLDSAKIYRMDNIGFSADQLADAMLELVRVNKMESCYLRPIVMRGYGEMGVNGAQEPHRRLHRLLGVGPVPGREALAEGVDVCVSSWNRLAPNTLPALAKAGANYMNSQLIKMEALANGYSEGIALDTAGYVSEGSGENIFVVRDGKIHTPPLGASVLPGITRDAILTLARDLGIPVVETIVPREMLYIADEVFFSGTAAEITPIRSVDRITVGKGRRGPSPSAAEGILRGRTRGRRRAQRRENARHGRGGPAPIHFARQWRPGRGAHDRIRLHLFRRAGNPPGRIRLSRETLRGRPTRGHAPAPGGTSRPAD
jgi:branched-chain amino acid aminotransferase